MKVHVHVKRKQALLTRVVVNVKQHSLKSLEKSPFNSITQDSRVIREWGWLTFGNCWVVVSVTLLRYVYSLSLSLYAQFIHHFLLLFFINNFDFFYLK